MELYKTGYVVRAKGIIQVWDEKQGYVDFDLATGSDLKLREIESKPFEI